MAKAEFHPVPMNRHRKRGGEDSLYAAKVLAEMQVTVRRDFELALHLARIDGWTLRELAHHTNLSYTTVKRYSEAAAGRGDAVD